MCPPVWGVLLLGCESLHLLPRVETDLSLPTLSRTADVPVDTRKGQASGPSITDPSISVCSRGFPGQRLVGCCVGLECVLQSVGEELVPVRCESKAAQ